jgi:putative membrane protein
LTQDCPLTDTRRSVTLQYCFLVCTVLILIVSLISPRYPHEQMLQHTPTVLGIIVMAVAARRRTLSHLSFACIILFMWLHIVGARHIYSDVPYDSWWETLFGSSLSEPFGWERNHYDRLVHLMFGVLCVPPVAELSKRWGTFSLAWALAFALLFVSAASAIYEIFEWLLAVAMDPKDAEAYNGQQGDLWDAQKDMVLAFVGSLVSVALLAVFKRPENAER